MQSCADIFQCWANDDMMIEGDRGVHRLCLTWKEGSACVESVTNPGDAAGSGPEHFKKRGAYVRRDTLFISTLCHLFFAPSAIC